MQMQSTKSETNLFVNSNNNNNHSQFIIQLKELDEELKIIDDKLPSIKTDIVKYSILNRIADERRASAKMKLEEENEHIKKINDNILQTDKAITDMKMDHEKLQLEINDNKIYLIRLNEWSSKCGFDHHKSLISKYNYVINQINCLQQHSKTQDEKILSLKKDISIHQGVNVDRLTLQNDITSAEIRLETLKKERINMDEKLNRLYDKMRKK